VVKFLVSPVVSVVVVVVVVVVSVALVNGGRGALDSVVLLLRLLFPIGTTLVVGVVVVAGAAGAAGVVAAAHLQLQRRRQIHSLALKISHTKNIKIKSIGCKKL